MTVLSKDSELKRAQFTQEILDDIRNVPNYCSFYSHVFSRIAALGLQMKAKKERLFENEDWSDLENRDVLMRKIEEFIIKYTR
ncbi:hypothetical protein LCGC14_2277680 [marine sediment metagenome]|uniref:Uncharacterized protein n=1 Tax=marine sediment metagenome TaxID=412755 RepID=A0A0F9DHB5_9ZZZZ|nr:hypothetical protein [bacterium]